MNPFWPLFRPLLYFTMHGIYAFNITLSQWACWNMCCGTPVERSTSCLLVWCHWTEAIPANVPGSLGCFAFWTVEGALTGTCILHDSAFFLNKKMTQNTVISFLIFILSTWNLPPPYKLHNVVNKGYAYLVLKGLHCKQPPWNMDNIKRALFTSMNSALPSKAIFQSG